MRREKTLDDLLAQETWRGVSSSEKATLLVQARAAWDRGGRAAALPHVEQAERRLRVRRMAALLPR